jgi:hypothetical protein
MKTYKTEFGKQKELKVLNKNLAQDLLDARSKVTEIWLDNQPTTEEEKAIWVRLGIAIEQIYEVANLLKKQ